MTLESKRTRLEKRQAEMRQRVMKRACENEFTGIPRMAICDPVQLGEVPCICGRIQRKPHCPNCGSYDVRARGDRNDVIKVDQTSGERRRVTTFRCNKCGLYYDRDQWMTECQAPQRVTEETRRREKEILERPQVENKVKQALDDPQMLLAVNKLRATRGLEPLTSLKQDDKDRKPQ